MTLGRDDLLSMLELVDITQADEIDCGEFLARVSGYLERLGPDGTPPPGHEEVVQHLRVCPECLQEFEALYAAWRDDSGAGRG